MDATNQIAAVSALEAATDALMIALGRRPEPDLVSAAAALKAREAALRYLVQGAPGSRPPDLNARLRRILERDAEAGAHLRNEMDQLKMRLADTRKMMATSRGRLNTTSRLR